MGKTIRTESVKELFEAILTLVLCGIGFGKSKVQINGILKAVPNTIDIPGRKVFILSIDSSVTLADIDLIMIKSSG